MHELRSHRWQDKDVHAERKALVARAEQLADRIFADPATHTNEAPRAALDLLHAEGFFLAPMPQRLGGLGLGTERGGHGPLLRVLAALGGADLALGRLFEGHVNALVLIHAYGTGEQIARAAEDARAGRLFGVWNTGDASPMHLKRRFGSLFLHGAKTFATGARFVERPILTAEYDGWQMTCPRMETPAVAACVALDEDTWQPFGMESSESMTIAFNDAPLEADDLIGEPGDFYREPLFRGGAVRFAAVQAGALLRLTRVFAQWLTSRKRETDPYQLARLGEIDLLAQEAVLWVERAAEIAELALWPEPAEAGEIERMVRCGNMTRLAIERAATALMAELIPGVGAHGLLRAARFERTLRDLTMYLRQPNPDGALAELGRAALGKHAFRYWSDGDSVATEFLEAVAS